MITIDESSGRTRAGASRRTTQRMGLMDVKIQCMRALDVPGPADVTRSRWDFWTYIEEVDESSGRRRKHYKTRRFTPILR